MKLRIVSGLLKNRAITCRETGAGFRPTKERVREAVAGILQERIPGARVADLCAGTGAFGFEMISRGAQSVHFVDAGRACCRSIEDHARLFQVGDRARTVCRDVRGYVRACAGRFDIVYYDPPYDDDELASLIPALLLCIAAPGVLVHERSSARGAVSAAIPDDFSVTTRKYGDTAVDFYYRMPPDAIHHQQKD